MNNTRRHGTCGRRTCWFHFNGSGTLVGEVLGGLSFDRDETKWRRCTMRRVLQQRGVDGGATREEQQQDKVDGIGLGPEQRRRSFWRLERPWASDARCHREVCEGAMSRRQRHCELQQWPRSWSTPTGGRGGGIPRRRGRTAPVEKHMAMPEAGLDGSIRGPATERRGRAGDDGDRARQR